MLSTLLSAQPKKRTHVISIDLGQHTTKAVSVQRKGTGFELLQYALKDAPLFEKGITAELLSEHLRSVAAAASFKGKPGVLVIGVQDSLLRHAELPAVPVNDMRLMLKFNAKNYLQQDLPDHVFDCQTLALAANAAASNADTSGRNLPKARVLVGGARQQLLDQLQEAAKLAGLSAEQIVPSLVCPANAFELAMPDVFEREVVALVDIGFKNSSITIVANRELALSRVVNFGADRLTQGLADVMGVTYAEAEGIKVGLPDEVQGAMQGLITPLGRELRASIDFFEHQQDRTVAQVFVSGGSARSQFIVESLQSELMVPTKSWSPISFMNLALPPEKLGEVEQVASQLTVAVGGAIAAL